VNNNHESREKFIKSETAATPQKYLSEAANSTIHKDNNEDQDIDASVKSIEHSPIRNLDRTQK
jgi:hypothetical protein